MNSKIYHRQLSKYPRLAKFEHFLQDTLAMLFQKQAGFFLLWAAFLFLRGGASGLSNLFFFRDRYGTFLQYDSWHANDTQFFLPACFLPDPSVIGLDLFLDLEPPGFQERLPVPKKGKNFVTVCYISGSLPKNKYIYSYFFYLRTDGPAASSSSSSTPA